MYILQTSLLDVIHMLQKPTVQLKQHVMMLQEMVIKPQVHIVKDTHVTAIIFLIPE